MSAQVSHRLKGPTIETYRCIALQFAQLVRLVQSPGTPGSQVIGGVSKVEDGLDPKLLEKQRVAGSDPVRLRTTIEESISDRLAMFVMYATAASLTKVRKFFKDNHLLPVIHFEPIETRRDHAPFCHALIYTYIMDTCTIDLALFT